MPNRSAYLVCAVSTSAQWAKADDVEMVLVDPDERVLSRRHVRAYISLAFSTEEAVANVKTRLVTIGVPYSDVILIEDAESRIEDPLLPDADDLVRTKECMVSPQDAIFIVNNLAKNKPVLIKTIREVYCKNRNRQGSPSQPPPSK